MVPARTALAVWFALSIAPLATAQKPTDPLPIPAIPGGESRPLESTAPRPANPFGPAAKPEVKPALADGIDLLRQAAVAFNKAKESEPAQFVTARDLFAQAVRERVKLTPEQTAAWAYCRIKVAADRLNRNTDAATAGEVLAEVEQALGTVPDQLNLHEATRDILAVARKRSGNKPAKTPAAVQAVEPGWEAIDTANVRVRYKANKPLAEDIARTAETLRGEVFKKWSGPPGGNWAPRCEVVLHPDADAFAAGTKLTAEATGRAEVKLTDGSASSRRIDLRADDPTLLDSALPRELTHVVLADLFPSQPPPKWAELGMAVLSTSEAEVGRYLQTVRRCARDGELLPVDKVLTATEVPAKAVTGFHVESVALVDFLVRWKGEKAFTGFVRDAQRYGTDTALKRQYGLADAKQLEESWRRGTPPTR